MRKWYKFPETLCKDSSLPRNLGLACIDYEEPRAGHGLKELILVLDMSISMQGEKLVATKKAALKLIDLINKGGYPSLTGVRLVTYGDSDCSSAQRFDVTRGTRSLEEKIGVLNATGETTLIGYLFEQKMIPRTTKGPDETAVLILTDGEDKKKNYRGRDGGEYVRGKLARRGYLNVVVVGLGKDDSSVPHGFVAGLSKNAGIACTPSQLCGSLDSVGALLPCNEVQVGRGTVLVRPGGWIKVCEKPVARFEESSISDAPELCKSSVMSYIIRALIARNSKGNVGELEEGPFDLLRKWCRHLWKKSWKEHYDQALQQLKGLSTHKGSVNARPSTSASMEVVRTASLVAEDRDRDPVEAAAVVTLQSIPEGMRRSDRAGGGAAVPTLPLEPRSDSDNSSASAETTKADDSSASAETTKADDSSASAASVGSKGCMAWVCGFFRTSGKKKGEEIKKPLISGAHKGHKKYGSSGGGS